MSIEASFPTIKPTLNLDFANTKELDPRITFTRASTATYYDGETTAVAEQNLILQSQAFDTAPWGPGFVTITGNTTTAPDGTTTADTIVANAGTALSPSVGQSGLSAIAGCYSFYAKAGTAQFLQLRAGNSSFYANFDLVNGIVGNSTGGTSSIQSVGNGWYRCIFVNSATAATIWLQIVTSATAPILQTWNPVGTESLYLWGAQLEQRASVTAYTPTTTAPITNYIPVLMTAQAGRARFDCNPTTGESLGFLIEEQRTNIQTYSAQFDNAVWSKTNATVIAETIIAPDGTLTGDKLVESIATGIHFIVGGGATISTATAYTGSVYIKAGERTWALVLVELGASNFQGYYVNLVTGALGNQQASGATAIVTNVGNGWYRIAITATSTGTTSAFRVYSATSNGGANYTGDGYSGIYLWGAQLEAGAFPTSYIPTVASQVTRSADVASMTGTNFSQWYSQSEGTIYGEAKGYAGATVGNGGAAPTICCAWQSGYVSINLYRNDGSGTGYPAFVINPSSPEALLQNTSLTFNSGSEIGMVGTYKYNDAALSVNGLTVTTDTLVTLPTPTSFQIGRLGSLYTGYWNGTIKKLAYYPTRLTNAQLQALTS